MSIERKIELKLQSEAFKEFCREKYITLVVLFGSRAQVTARPDSDWDLAVLVEKESLPPRGQELGRFRRALIRDFCSFLETSTFDLVLLNTASPLMKYNVARTGHPIYQKNHSIFPEFVSLAVRQHEDARLFYKMEEVYLRNRLKD